MDKVRINKKRDETVVFLDTTFYPSEDIMEATRAFSESCWVTAEGDAKSIMQVNLKPRSKHIELDKIGYEFYNYVLGVIKNKRG